MRAIKLFIGEDYDVVSDKIKRFIPDDPRILEEVYVAYCQIRRTKSAARNTKLRDELDLIHANLVKRIDELEPIRPTPHDGE